MASGKLSPRQKMINLMYLMLIAMLALNVSREIIKTFHVLENSLDESTLNITNKSLKMRNSILSKANTNNEKAKVAYEIAEQLKNNADEFYKSIEAMKKDLENRADGREKIDKQSKGKPELKQGDNIEKHAHYFIHEKNGEKLEKNINETRKKLISALHTAKENKLLNPEGKNTRYFEEKIKEIEFKSMLVADQMVDSEGKKIAWSNMFLENAPLAGVMTILSKLQNDCRIMESDITQILAETIGINDIGIDSVNAVISAPSSAIMTGETYEADLILAAYNSNADMQVMVNGQAVDVVNGKGKIKFTGTNPGEFSYNVSMQVPGMDKPATTQGKYAVFAPMASVSCDELQILYVGMENPITVSAAGVKPEDLILSSSMGNLKKIANGKYHVLIPTRTGNECVVTVQARTSDGRVVNLAKQIFRVRNVSKPSFSIPGIDLNKPVPVSSLCLIKTISASNPDFPYQSAQYKILSCKVNLVGQKGPHPYNIVGNNLSSISSALCAMRPGEFVFFSDIRVQKPDGVTYLNPISLQIGN